MKIDTVEMKLKPWEVKVLKFKNPQDPREPPKLKEIADKYEVLVGITKEEPFLSYREIVIEGLEGRREEAKRELEDYLSQANSDEFKKELDYTREERDLLLKYFKKRNLSDIGEECEVDIHETPFTIHILGPPSNLQYFEHKCSQVIKQTKVPEQELAKTTDEIGQLMKRNMPRLFRIAKKLKVLLIEENGSIKIKGHRGLD